MPFHPKEIHVPDEYAMDRQHRRSWDYWRRQQAENLRKALGDELFSVAALITETRPVDPRPLFPVVCLWCESEGVRTVLGFSQAQDSHGICKRHAEEMLREAARQRRENEITTGGH